MFKPMLLAALAGATALAALPAAAQGRGAHGPLPAFETFDADGDNRVTRDEVTAARRAAISGLDADADGALTREEIVAFQTRREQARIEERVARLMTDRDLNGDNRLSADELLAGHGPGLLGPAGMPAGQVERFFARADADGDGAITRAEADRMRDRMEPGRDGERGRRPHHEDDHGPWRD